MSVAVLEDHLTTCSDCARWVSDATRASRLARLDVTPVPDLTDLIVAQVALPARRVNRRRRWLQAGLLLAGFVQLAVGLPAVLGDSIGMAMAAHAAHEMAAWNIAIGAAFVAAALIPRRAAGLIPLLATFLVVLAALSIHDVESGAVGAARLATHAAALIGLLLLVGLDRTERARPPAPVTSSGRSRRDRRDPRDDDGTDLRTVA